MTGKMFYFIQTTCGGIKLFILIQLLQFRKYCIIHKKKKHPYNKNEHNMERILPHDT